MTRLTAGQAIVKSLLAHKIDTIFCLPGVQSDHFFNALFDEGDKIRAIHTRHEQGAAYMALGAALATGKPAVYSVVPGPGFLNSTAALATAQSTFAPVMCLTGQIPSTTIGREYGMLHEIPDQLGILKTLTKWAARIPCAMDAPELVHTAFHQMQSGRPGPVGLECAMDILPQSTAVDLDRGKIQPRPLPIDDEAVSQAAALLKTAKRPLIVVGGGALNAAQEVKNVAEFLQAPVIASRMGRGVLDDRHYLSHTMPGGNMLWKEADVVLGIGTRMQAELMNWGTDKDLKIIRLNIDASELNRITKADVGMIGDAKPTLAALYEELERTGSPQPSREEEMLELKAVMAKKFEVLGPQIGWLKAIRDELPEEGLFVEELTQVGYVSRFAFPVYSPRTFISMGYQGTLGWGLASALGVKVARPDVPVVAIAGDGGFMFNVQELATAVQHRIPLVTVVFNDGAFGNVQRMQKELHGNRVIATDLTNPDFVKLAKSFGARGVRVTTPDALRPALQEGFKADGPTVIEVPVGEMPSPWEDFIFLPKVRPASQVNTQKKGQMQV